jgi:hypothetical protein
MPCQTCGGSGHNTTSCGVRKTVEYVAGKVGSAKGHTAGAIVSAHLGFADHGATAYAGGRVGSQMGVAGAKYVLKTDAQKQYEQRKANK